MLPVLQTVLRQGLSKIMYINASKIHNILIFVIFIVSSGVVPLVLKKKFNILILSRLHFNVRESDGNFLEGWDILFPVPPNMRSTELDLIWSCPAALSRSSLLPPGRTPGSLPGLPSAPEWSCPCHLTPHPLVSLSSPKVPCFLEHQYLLFPHLQALFPFLFPVLTSHLSCPGAVVTPLGSPPCAPGSSWFTC